MKPKELSWAVQRLKVQPCDLLISTSSAVMKSINAPRGVPHAFKVSGADGARLLCLHTPGCCQAFYWDASEPVGSDDTRGVDGGPVDMSRVQASAAKNGGIEILGPPPFNP